MAAWSRVAKSEYAAVVHGPSTASTASTALRSSAARAAAFASARCESASGAPFRFHDSPIPHGGADDICANTSCCLPCAGVTACAAFRPGPTNAAHGPDAILAAAIRSGTTSASPSAAALNTGDLRSRFPPGGYHRPDCRRGAAGCQRLRTGGRLGLRTPCRRLDGRVDSPT